MKLVIYIRALIACALFAIGTGILSATGVISNIIFNRRKFDNKIVETWGKLAFFLFNVELKVYGRENMPQKQGAVVLFNHSSFMDIFTICQGLYNIRFG